MIIVEFTFGQSKNTPFRLELDAPETVYPYEVISMGSKGIIIYYESDIISRTNAKWTFVHYDAFFKKTWKRDVLLYRDMEPVKDYTDSLFAGVLFNYQGKRKPEFINQIVSIQLHDTLVSSFTIPVAENSYPNLLLVAEKYSFFSIMKKDGEDFFVLNRETNECKAINLNEKKEEQSVAFLRQIKNNSSDITCGYITNLSRKANQINVVNVDVSGGLTSLFVIPAQSKYFYNSADCIYTGKDSMLIIGNYINAVERPNLIGGSEDKNTGVYVAVVRNNMVEKIHFYNFSKFTNIYKYLTDKDLQRIKRKVGDDDDSQQGYSLNLSLLSHNPKLINDSVIIVLNEAYYAEYRTEENLSYDYYGRPFPTNRTVFDGYRYTNGLICGISKNGDLLWDNNFALNNILTYQLKPRISFFKDTSELIMAYNHNGEIVSLIIQENKVIQTTEYSKVETLSTSDFVLENEKSDIIHWYNNYFLCFGYQTIRNSQKRGKNRVNVFYLTKMIYEYQ